MLFLDGAYAFSGNRPILHRALRPVGEEVPNNPLLAKVMGFSLHAATG
jgi:hypothetical protein